MHSLRFGKFMGISLELHSTFIIFILLLAVIVAIFDSANFIATMLLIFLLFLSVFIHELVHSVVAVMKGIRVERIILLPIGGIAMTEEMPEKPWDEFIIAIAGPAFNFAVAFIIALLWYLVPGIPMPSPSVIAAGLGKVIMNYPLFAFLYINLILGAFNLFLPALPLDGGRVFRALLAFKFGFARATAIIAKASIFIAIFLFIIGMLIGDIILPVIAIFIYFGAGQENEMAMLKFALRGIKVKSVMLKKPPIAPAQMNLQDLFVHMQKTNKTEFLVKAHNGYGVVNAEMLSKIPKSAWRRTLVKKIAVKAAPIGAEAEITSVLAKILGKEYSMLPVMRNGKLLGALQLGEINRRYQLEKINKKL